MGVGRMILYLLVIMYVVSLLSIELNNNGMLLEGNSIKRNDDYEHFVEVFNTSYNVVIKFVELENVLDLTIQFILNNILLIVVLIFIKLIDKVGINLY